MLKGFRDFILRGNVADLAVAVIIGAAFSGIVTSLVNDVLKQFIAAVLGKPDFSYVVFPICMHPHTDRQLPHPPLWQFIIVASVVYFGVSCPSNHLLARIQEARAAVNPGPAPSASARFPIGRPPLRPLRPAGSVEAAVGQFEPFSRRQSLSRIPFFKYDGPAAGLLLRVTSE